jgi:hypothetical protein
VIIEHESTLVETEFPLEILPQPDDTTCGPTCLHAVYRHYGLDLPLSRVIAECPQLDEGGTLGVLLGCHALRSGFRATIFTFNLQVFDPTWFQPPPGRLAAKLEAQMAAKDVPKLHTATRAYLEFLAGGGEILMEDLTAALIRKYVKRQIPVLTGLSATYLYRDPREIGPAFTPDDIGGSPSGHFVILCGYDPPSRGVVVADPLSPNPLAPAQRYVVDVDRLICAILLGILTYDANLLIIEPPGKHRRSERAHPDRGE